MGYINRMNDRYDEDLCHLEQSNAIKHFIAMETACMTDFLDEIN